VRTKTNGAFADVMLLRADGIDSVIVAPVVR